MCSLIYLSASQPFVSSYDLYSDCWVLLLGLLSTVCDGPEDV
jgi:hypothetical protein